ncbi:hypothetical protein K8I61_06540, partial [bacterium]|nr:hypothetical protein [bacterium]
LWPSVNGHAPRHPDDFCEKSDTLDYPPNAMSVIRAAAVAAPDIPARDRVFAGLAEYPLNAVRRWQTRDPRPNRAPRIFVAGVRAPGGAAGHYDAGAVTLWRIERPATVIVAAAPGGRTSATITAPPPGDGNDEPSLIAIEIEGMIDNGHPVSGPLDQYMVPSKPHARRGAVEGSPDHDIAAASRDWFASNDCDYAQALVRLAPGASARIVADAPPTAVRAWILQSGAPAPRVRDAQAIVQISRADTAPIVSAPADDGVPPTSIRAYFLAQVR